MYHSCVSSDTDGVNIVLGWTQEYRDQASYEAANWAGALSLPREVFALTEADGVGSSGHLGVRPYAGVHSLRGSPSVASAAGLQNTQAG